MKKRLKSSKAKKLTALLLAAGMCVSLAACGSGTDEQSAQENAQTSAASTEAAQTQTESQGTEAAQSTDAASGQGASLRIAWWGSQERHNDTIEALDLYAEETGSEFTYEYTSWTSYFENLATQTVGGNLPDIIQMSTTDIINYSQNGQIIDLQPYVDDGTIDVTNIDESSLSGGMVNGQLAGFTTGSNTIAVFYNTEIFDQAGVAYPSDDWTWSEFLSTAKEIYDATGIQTEIPFLSEARWAVEAMVRSMGYDFFSEDGTSLPWAEDEAVVTAVANTIQSIYEGVQEGYLVDPEVQVAWSATEDYYISQGNAAMSLNLSNYYTVYSQALGQELGLAMVPQMDEGTQTGMYLNPNMYWSISANCENPQAAAAVINYLINDETAAKLIGTDRGISLSSAIRDMMATDAETDVYTKNSLEYVNRVSAVVSSTNPADPVNSAELISVLKNDYVAVMYGEMTAQDCVADFIAQAASILP